MVVYRSRQEHGNKTNKDPGVAKFGIALEWGSRGLEFESRHSDQKAETVLLFLLFSFCVINVVHY